MTKQERDAILSYVADNFISPLCDNEQSGDELYPQYCGDKFNQFVKFVNDLNKSKCTEEIYDKNTTLVYLINELSPQKNYVVSTELTKEGCWAGRVIIQETRKQHESENYYLTLAKKTSLLKENLPS
jgi:hypothetical protein